MLSSSFSSSASVNSRSVASRATARLRSIEMRTGASSRSATLCGYRCSVILATRWVRGDWANPSVLRRWPVGAGTNGAGAYSLGPVVEAKFRQDGSGVLAEGGHGAHRGLAAGNGDRWQQHPDGALRRGDLAPAVPG